MLAAAACKSLAPALLLLFLGCTGITSAAPGDVAAAALGPAATGLCQEPVVLEPGVSSVHCISPAIRMTPGQVHRICSSHFLHSYCLAGWQGQCQT